MKPQRQDAQYWPPAIQHTTTAIFASAIQFHANHFLADSPRNMAHGHYVNPKRRGVFSRPRIGSRSSYWPPKHFLGLG
jgi:hypothetical protein